MRSPTIFLVRLPLSLIKRELFPSLPCLAPWWWLKLYSNPVVNIEQKVQLTASFSTRAMTVGVSLKVHPHRKVKLETELVANTLPVGEYRVIMDFMRLLC